jgi:hypothetical protein
MKINNQTIKAKKFAFDGCHKIYLIESEEDLKEALEIGYDIYPIGKLKNAYKNSCSLKFINNWQLNKCYAEQCEPATIEV